MCDTADDGVGISNSVSKEEQLKRVGLSSADLSELMPFARQLANARENRDSHIGFVGYNKTVPGNKMDYSDGFTSLEDEVNSVCTLVETGSRIMDHGTADHRTREGGNRSGCPGRRPGRRSDRLRTVRPLEAATRVPRHAC